MPSFFDLLQPDAPPPPPRGAFSGLPDLAAGAAGGAFSGTDLGSFAGGGLFGAFSPIVGVNLRGGPFSDQGPAGPAAGIYRAPLSAKEQALDAARAARRAPVRVGTGAGPIPADVPADYQAHIQRASAATGVEPALLSALIQNEGGFRPDAVSRAGAIGPAQLMPPTAVGVGVNPYDVGQNILGGARYLAQQLASFGGDERKALWAYNAGPGQVRAGVLPAETGPYIDRVLAQRDAYRQAAATAAATPLAAATAPGAAPAAAGGLPAQVLGTANQWLGTGYAWGGTSRAGVDCSGLVLAVFRELGVPFAGRPTAEGIRQASTPVPAGAAQPGDLIFFQNTDPALGPGQASHVGIVQEDGIMLDANDARGSVGRTTLSPWWNARVLDIRRPPQYAAGGP